MIFFMFYYYQIFVINFYVDTIRLKYFLVYHYLATFIPYRIQILRNFVSEVKNWILKKYLFDDRSFPKYFTLTSHIVPWNPHKRIFKELILNRIFFFLPENPFKSAALKKKKFIKTNINCLNSPLNFHIYRYGIQEYHCNHTYK